MKIAKIEKVGKRKVYDISVKEVEHYILDNGVVSHNTSVQYSPNSVFFVGREQVKEGTQVVGYKFNLTIDKSRRVIERSKLPIEVSFEEGINKWSSLLDIALELGLVIAPTKGWYSRVIEGVVEEKKWRRKDTDNNEFWDVLLEDPEFEAGINKLYRLE